MTERPIDVVHVGAASRDLTEADPRGWRLGGGASYAALTTARLGLRTAAIVGVDREAATATELDLLRDAGVELQLVHLGEMPVFRNLDTGEGRRQLCIAPGVALPIPSIPPAWLAAPAWSIVPVAGELGEAWAEVVPEAAVVALGWQGLLRTLVRGQEVARRAPTTSRLLARADLVGVSRHDLLPGTRVAELLPLLRPGVRLVVTDGRTGGRLVRARPDGRPRSRPYGPVRADRELDPTGAGDVFLAALLAATIRPGTIDRAGHRGAALDLRFAAAAASFVVEGPGLLGVPHRAAVLERMGAR